MKEHIAVELSEFLILFQATYFTSSNVSLDSCVKYTIFVNLTKTLHWKGNFFPKKSLQVPHFIKGTSFV